MDDNLQPTLSKAEEKKEASEERNDTPKPVSFWELFRFMDFEGRMLFGLGVSFALIAGASLPAINVAFGE